MPDSSSSTDGPSGPRLIHHAADEERPTLDPRLQATASALQELHEHKRKLEALQDAARAGDPLAAMQLTEAMTDAVNAHALAMATLPTAQEQSHAFITKLPRELRRIRAEYVEVHRRVNDPAAGKLEIVDVDGSQVRGRALGYFRAELVDGTWGALQRRSEDCLQAAIATLVQAPAHTVPDLKIGKLMDAGKDPEEMDRIIGHAMGTWCERNGVTVLAHVCRLPVYAKRWIGVVDVDNESTGNSHCVLMQHREVIFDTAWLLPPRKDEPPAWHSFDDVEFGITLDPRR